MLEASDRGVDVKRRLRALLLSWVAVGGLLIGFSTNAVAATAAKHHTITVTLTDNGHRYRLQKGDVLDVQLSGPANVTWTEPTTSNQAVLQRTGGSSGATATANFVATKKGKSEVNATGSFPCSEVCTPLLLGFDIYVSIVG